MNKLALNKTQHDSFFTECEIAWKIKHKISINSFSAVTCLNETYTQIAQAEK